MFSANNIWFCIFLQFLLVLPRFIPRSINSACCCNRDTFSMYLLWEDSINSGHYTHTEAVQKVQHIATWFYFHSPWHCFSGLWLYCIETSWAVDKPPGVSQIGLQMVKWLPSHSKHASKLTKRMLVGYQPVTCSLKTHLCCPVGSGLCDVIDINNPMFPTIIITDWTKRPQ